MYGSYCREWGLMSPRLVILQTASNKRYAREHVFSISSAKPHLKTNVFQCFLATQI